jgi:predicted SprT family Zn-dependent metalloprotease
MKELFNKEDIIFIINTSYSSKIIEEKFNNIIDSILKKSSHFKEKNYGIISISDLEFIFYLYDEIYFENRLKKYSENISFNLSRRLSRSAGTTQFFPTTSYSKITLATNILYQNFNSENERKILVNGFECKNRLEATLKILEHEIIHLLEFFIFKKSSCKKKQFKQLSFNFFNHTKSTHELITQNEIAIKKFGLSIGNEVFFTFKTKILKGKIHKITKRATIFCEDKNGEYRNKIGNRFKKYLIPIEFLYKTKKDAKESLEMN